MHNSADTDLCPSRAEMRRLQANQQKLMTQKNENELVRQELELATDDNKIYRLVGPVLTSQTKAEALETVDKRIQFISEQLCVWYEILPYFYSLTLKKTTTGSD